MKKINVNDEKDDGQIVDYIYDDKTILLSMIDYDHIKKYKLDFHGCSDNRARIYADVKPRPMDLK